MKSLTYTFCIKTTRTHLNIFDVLGAFLRTRGKALNRLGILYNWSSSLLASGPASSRLVRTTFSEVPTSNFVENLFDLSINSFMFIFLALRMGLSRQLGHNLSPMGKSKIFPTTFLVAESFSSNSNSRSMPRRTNQYWALNCGNT